MGRRVDLVNTEIITGFSWAFIKKYIQWPGAIREKRFTNYGRRIECVTEKLPVDFHHERFSFVWYRVSSKICA